jgi:hypothetical protein
VNTNHSSTETPDPAASHDQDGWWRRGAALNSRAKATITKPMLSGHRSRVQRVLTTPDSPTAWATSAPPTISMKAATESTPAVQASLKPFQYLSAVGRSCSTP